jgi:hypothetical protein
MEKDEQNSRNGEITPGLLHTISLDLLIVDMEFNFIADWPSRGK